MTLLALLAFCGIFFWGLFALPVYLSLAALGLIVVGITWE